MRREWVVSLERHVFNRGFGLDWHAFDGHGVSGWGHWLGWLEFDHPVGVQEVAVGEEVDGAVDRLDLLVVEALLHRQAVLDETLLLRVDQLGDPDRIAALLTELEGLVSEATTGTKLGLDLTVVGHGQNCNAGVSSVVSHNDVPPIVRNPFFSLTQTTQTNRSRRLAKVGE